jgi:hypothetical protein
MKKIIKKIVFSSIIFAIVFVAGVTFSPNKSYADIKVWTSMTYQSAVVAGKIGSSFPMGTDLKVVYDNPDIRESETTKTTSADGDFTVKIIGLDPETKYDFTVITVSDGKIIYSDSFTTLVKFAVTVKAEPTKTEALITGTIRGGQPSDSYEITYSSSSDLTTATHNAISPDSDGNFSLKLTGLTESTTYYYMVNQPGATTAFAKDSFTTSSVSGDGTKDGDNGTKSTAHNIPIIYRNPLTVNSVDALMSKVVDAIVILLTPLIVIMLVWTGFLFVKARGNAEQLTVARKALMYTLLGAIIVLVAKGFSLAIKSIFSQF